MAPSGRSAISSGALVMSASWPAVSLSLIGRPLRSTSAWILVVRPPLERPRHRSGPPFCRGTMLVHAHDRTVDHLNIAVIGCHNGIHQPIPDTRLSPSVDPVVARRPRAVAFRQIRPGRARTQNPENPVQHSPVVNPRHTARLVRKMRLDRFPLKIRQIVAAHRKLPFESLNHDPPGLKSLNRVYEYTT